MNRLTLYIASFLLMLLPVRGFALGLGPIVQLSHLHQPLEARVPIIAATQAELDSLKVTLADNEAFQKSGLKVPVIGHNLRFTLVTDTDSPHVRIHSHQSVREPSLSLLIDFIWARGHRRQQYTLLLDPVQR